MMTLALGLAWAAASPAAAPDLDEIVRRTIAVMDRHPAEVVCQTHLDNQLMDGSGKLKESAQADIEEVRHGWQVRWNILRMWKNGRELGPRERQKEGRQQESPTARNVWPFSQEGPAHYRYELLGREVLWGHPTYVLKVIARQREEGVGNGTAWIDASTFIQLKGEFMPVRPPDRVDWVKVQEQWALQPGGYVVPSSVRLEGAGHWLFIRRRFSITLTWGGCR